MSLLSNLSGCANGAPIPPEFKIYQPIIDQKICDEQGACEVKSLCREYYRDLRSGEVIFVSNHELKTCHGIFGVTSDDVKNLKDYSRKLKAYIEDLQAQLIEVYD